MTCGIYKLTNNINGKIYIGQSCDIEKRWKQHKRTKRLGHLYSAFKKHGLDNFTFSIILDGVEYYSKREAARQLGIASSTLLYRLKNV